MVITNHRLGSFNHGGGVGAHSRHTTPRQPEAMDPGCVTSRRRAHVAARCYRCTTRVATIFLENVQKQPERSIGGHESGVLLPYGTISASACHGDLIDHMKTAVQ